jgi:lactoylglutathione lyase
MAEIIGLAHIGVFVKDIKKSQKFYAEILGLETIHECVFEGEDNTFTIAFMKKGSLCLEIVMREHQTELGDGVVAHIAMQVDDLDGMIQKLGALGIEFETKEPVYHPTMLGGGTKWIFFRGPDNEHLEISQIL